MVIVQKALPESVVILEIAADPFEDGKAPFQLHGAAVGLEVEVVAEHDPQPVPFPEIVGPDLTIPEVIFDVGVIVISGLLRDAVPALQEKREIPPFESSTGRDAVPASGQRFGLPIGLVIKAHVYKAAPQSQEVIVGTKVEKKFRLIIRFPKRRGVFEIVKLPERPLGIGDPKISLVAENISQEFDLEA